MTDNAKIAVLLMAYGAAATLEDVPAYLQDIRGGRPAGPELIAEIQKRYQGMGGKSPLLDITRAQAAALASKIPYKVYLGMRHAPPTIQAAVHDIKNAGHHTVVAMPLTPYYSKLSVGAYMKKYEEALAAEKASFKTIPIHGWNNHPKFIEAWSQKVAEALSRFKKTDQAQVTVIFSAHSLPSRIVGEGDPYPEKLAETAKAIALKTGAVSWQFAYQSRGATNEPWLGPDVSETLDALAAQSCKNVVIAPIGFVSDHMETLYDDDVLYKQKAEKLGMRFERAQSLNDDPLFIEAMADVIRQNIPSPASARAEG